MSGWTIRLVTACSLERLRLRSQSSDDLLVSASYPWIARNGHACVLARPHMRVLLPLLIRQSLSLPEMLEIIYGQRPDGGPLTADKITMGHLSAINAVLPVFGLELRTVRDGHYEVMRRSS
jgi:hypothetical protein